MAESLQELGDHIAQATGRAVIASYVRLGELMLDAMPESLIALLGFLRVDPRCLFKQLVDVPGKLTHEFRTFDFVSPWEGVKQVLPGDEKAPAAPQEQGKTS